MKSAVLASTLVAALLAGLAGCSKESSAGGRHNTTLSLKKPSNQTIKQGESDKVGVSIDRSGFADAVTVTFSNLPVGVKVTETSIPAGDSSRDFTLVADPTAAVVNNHVVTVTAKGHGADTTQTFELTVKPKG